MSEDEQTPDELPLIAPIYAAEGAQEILRLWLKSLSFRIEFFNPKHFNPQFPKPPNQ